MPYEIRPSIKKSAFSLNNSNSLKALFFKAFGKKVVCKRVNVLSSGGSGEIRTHG
jgi:hypothetical protein